MLRYFNFESTAMVSCAPDLFWIILGTPNPPNLLGLMT